MDSIYQDIAEAFGGTEAASWPGYVGPDAHGRPITEGDSLRMIGNCAESLLTVVWKATAKGAENPVHGRVPWEMIGTANCVWVDAR